ncbi:AAEL012321-PA [Aedes aegypti]|uniref:AAEL012321-PA n=1 Tax=Aedes aegypti TaxID=7159 RepID=Q16MF1_AEDAE|nr:AAEL012321-PA [Aedes aegypti]
MELGLQDQEEIKSGILLKKRVHYKGNDVSQRRKTISKSENCRRKLEIERQQMNICKKSKYKSPCNMFWECTFPCSEGTEKTAQSLSATSNSSPVTCGYPEAENLVGQCAISFGGQPGSGGFVSSRSEPISLATLDKDCFIIPVHSLDRFLPAGIPLPTPETTDPSQSGPLSVLEVSDPKICILAHLMSPLEPIDPLLESPLAHPLTKQRAVASELLNEVQQGNNAVGGMLLANMERSSSEFPFIAYYVINTTQTDPTMFYTGVRGASLSKFEPKNTRYTAAHTLDLYSEVASICRPPLALAPNEIGSVKKGQTPTTGYIISVYKVGPPGADRKR